MALPTMALLVYMAGIPVAGPLWPYAVPKIILSEWKERRS